MLYDRWQEVMRARRRQIALREAASGRAWTFAELDAAAQRAPVPSQGCVFPTGSGPEFLFAVLAAWRAGRCVCPLEAREAAPVTESPPPWCAHLKTTSATTGRARLVAFRAEQLAADATNIVATMGLRPDWPNLAAISMAHSYGFSNLVLPLLLHGIPLKIAPSSLPEAVRRAAEGEPALTLPAVPALWRAWHEAKAIPATVRLAISAGAPLPLHLEKAVFGDRGLKIHNFYGSSECGGIAFDRTLEPRRAESCAGRPMEHVSVAVGEAGCLEVRGANVAEGYGFDPGEAFAGVFRTADVARIEWGEVHLLGRASDIINVAGRKVAPETIEQALRTHPFVREALVLGLPGSAGGREEIIAAVVAVAGDVSETDLRSFLGERLPGWQMPREWRFVDSLPVNPRGKIGRAEWRRRLTGQPRGAHDA